MRRLAILLLSVATIISCLLATAAPAHAATTDSTSEAGFLRLLNLARAGTGLGMLDLDPAASNVARGWSNAMATAGVLSHNPNYVNQISQLVTNAWTRVGENVGVGPSVDSLQQAFWNSAGHRANILGAYNRVGIGAVRDGSGQLWVTFDFVQGPAISPNSGVDPCASTPGYILDGFGGVHAVAGAPSLGAGPYWGGWDIARDLRTSGGQGWLLDGFGGVHSLGSARHIATSAYWSGWDIARSMAITPDGAGVYVLDGWGGVHPGGTAKAVTQTGYWPGWDIARDIEVDPTTGDRGYTLDGFGGLHAFGNMPSARITAYQSGDFAQSFRFLPDGTGGYVLDTAGHAHPFAVGSNPMPAELPSLTPMGGRASYLLFKNGAGSLVTGGGAVLGLGTPCGAGTMWGTWNIARAAATA